MKKQLRDIWDRQAFFPSYLLGMWINPFFIIRRGLLDRIRQIAGSLSGGNLLDVGCGSKPYEELFDVTSYVGIDVEVSGHNHVDSRVDQFYDGKSIPFDDASFDSVFSSEVFEHVKDIEELIREINRVLKPGGYLGFTCPFVWEEHEQPYDFRRYTTFGLYDLLQRNGFEVVRTEKSTGYVATLFQMMSAYVWQHTLPRNVFVRLLFLPIIVAPLNIAGVVLNKILPANGNFYHNNVLLAKKIADPT